MEQEASVIARATQMDQKPDVFPNEAFVLRAIRGRFARLGFVVAQHEKYKHCDILMSHPESGEKWAIECKGQTSSIGVDFNTGLGQLLKRMEPGSTKYGVGLPRIDSFARQTEQIHLDILARLGIHWIWVNRDGSVEIKTPHSLSDNVIAEHSRN